MNEILFGKVLRFSLEEVIWIGTSPEKSGILRLASPEGTGQLAGYLVDIACPKIPKLGELLARYTFFTFEILLPVLEKQSNSKERKYEFTPANITGSDKISISFQGIEPFQILQMLNAKALKK